MIEITRTRIPELTAVVQDARHFHKHFAEESFDLIATHFITGFVPMADLAPKIWSRLAEGGYWSFVGAPRLASRNFNERPAHEPYDGLPVRADQPWMMLFATPRTRPKSLARWKPMDSPFCKRRRLSRSSTSPTWTSSLSLGTGVDGSRRLLRRWVCTTPA